MAIEIERKFLVRDESWRAASVQSKRICQGYLERGAAASVRVRIVNEQAAVLTIKSSAIGLRRMEFEYSIPLPDAEQLLLLCKSTLAKTRHEVPWCGLTWEIDVFAGSNTGLVIAEIEVEHEEQLFQPPPWLGAEITGDARYYNSYLAEHPFSASA